MDLAWWKFREGKKIPKTLKLNLITAEFFRTWLCCRCTYLIHFITGLFYPALVTFVAHSLDFVLNDSPVTATLLVETGCSKSVFWQLNTEQDKDLTLESSEYSDGGDMIINSKLRAAKRCVAAVSMHL